MRRMQRMLLSALGVRNVIEKAHGGEAIEFLRDVKDNPTKAGVSSVDMVMSNWQMDPIDGAMLLKWVRRSKESPDRFIPFSDGFRVWRRRESGGGQGPGGEEFVAKPYSVGQLLTRLMLVVGSPRQFVLLDTFFGPDRRRRTAAPPGKNRRIMPESEIEIIHDDT